MWDASKQGTLVADGRESTIAHLTGVKLRAHRFVFPPISEQKAITRYLDSSGAAIIKAVSNTEGEIALIREYSARLIADELVESDDVPDDGEIEAEPEGPEA
jgi:type I restriction enzyme S subunit